MATILVADDQAMNRELLGSMLRHAGHEVLEAADGVEALEIARGSHPDLVVADILMPRMDGYELVRELRADPRIADTAVIFATANYLEHEVRPIAEACGVTEVLPKPLEPEVFLRAVEQALENSVRPPLPVEDDFDRRHLRALNTKLVEKIRELEGAYKAVQESEAALVDAEAERDRLAERKAVAQRLESLGEMAAGIAHDFNNLLAVIMNYAAFIHAGADRVAEWGEGGMEELAERIHNDAGEVLRASERAAALTHQLLVFARHEVSHPAPVDLEALVHGLHEMLDRALGERVALTLDLAGDLPAVLADPARLEQAVVNLVVNAVDASDGDGEVVIATGERACPTHDGRRHTCLRVADSGVGMPPEVVSRAFEPFFTTKPRGKGTGLGLSTVYGIVTQLGGDIDIESSPGEGTTITLHLPAHHGPATPGRKEAEGAVGQSVEARGETVLVAEDDATLLEAVVRSLREHGYRIAGAGGSQEALVAAHDHEGAIDLLVSDVVMPTLSGPDLAAQVCSLHPETRVLFMSGYAEGMTGTSDLTPDAAFLSKPFRTTELLTAIRTTLDGQESDGQGPP